MEGECEFNIMNCLRRILVVSNNPADIDDSFQGFIGLVSWNPIFDGQVDALGNMLTGFGNFISSTLADLHSIRGRFAENGPPTLMGKILVMGATPVVLPAIMAATPVLSNKTIRPLLIQHPNELTP
jgi:hypothetical protein